MLLFRAKTYFLTLSTLFMSIQAIEPCFVSVEPACPGEDNGQIMVVAPVPAPLTYHYSGPKSGSGVSNSSTFTISNLPVGTYGVTCVNRLGSCTTNGIFVPEANISVNVTPINGPSGCVCEGQVILSPTTNFTVFAYVYTLSGPNGTTMVTTSANPYTFTGLCGGPYSWTVAASSTNDCVVSSHGTFNLAGLSHPLSQPSLSVVSPTCSNGSTGQVEVSYMGGVGSVFYSTDGINYSTVPSNQFKISGLGNSVTVYLRDTSGCPATHTSITLGTATAPTVTIQATSLDICGASLPVLTALPAGGSGSYSILWTLPNSTASSSNPLTANQAGLYMVVATDTVSGCMSTPASIMINDTLTAGIMPASPSFCTGSSTVLTGVATIGGGGTLTYQWYFNSLSNPISGATNPTLTVSQAGTYYVVITQVGEQECTGTASVTVVENQPPTVTIVQGTQPSCGPVLLGTSVEQGTGTSITSYQWYLNGVAIIGATGPIDQATQSGMYTVTATDNNGCMSAPSPAVTLTVTSCVALNQCCAVLCDKRATITVTVTNTGTEPITEPLVVAEQLPCCLQLVDEIGAGWTFAQSGQTITATYANPNGLAAGTSARFVLTVKLICKQPGILKPSAQLVGVANVTASCCLKF